jgi:hypothetical protein
VALIAAAALLLTLAWPFGGKDGRTGLERTPTRVNLDTQVWGQILHRNKLAA